MLCHFGTHSSFASTIKIGEMAISIPILLMMKLGHRKSLYLNPDFDFLSLPPSCNPLIPDYSNYKSTIISYHNALKLPVTNLNCPPLLFIFKKYGSVHMGAPLLETLLSHSCRFLRSWSPAWKVSMSQTPGFTSCAWSVSACSLLRPSFLMILNKISKQLPALVFTPLR